MKNGFIHRAGETIVDYRGPVLFEKFKHSRLAFSLSDPQWCLIPKLLNIDDRLFTPMRLMLKLSFIHRTPRP